jgi:hypothetical protein
MLTSTCSAALLAQRNRLRRCSRQRKLKGAAAPANQPRSWSSSRRVTDSASHPNVFVMFGVGLAGPPSVADDRPAAAKRAPPREKLRRDLGHRARSCFPAGVKAGCRPSCPVRSRGWPSPSGKVSLERKRKPLSVGGRQPLIRDIGRYCGKTWLGNCPNSRNTPGSTRPCEATCRLHFRSVVPSGQALRRLIHAS